MPKLKEIDFGEDAASEVVAAAPAKKNVSVFIIKDDLNPKNIKCYGWINEKYYEYTRGAVHSIPAHIASEIIATGNGMEVK